MKSPIKLFISHSSKDMTFARKLRHAFETNDVDVWMDEGSLKIGDKLTDTFREAIEEADYFILVISEHSVQSQWVRQECMFAVETHTNILPIRIDQSNLFPEIHDYKFLEFSFSNFDDFTFPFNELLQSIGLADKTAFKPTLTNIQFYDEDPTTKPKPKPKKIFKQKLFHPKYIYVSWKPKYFYPGLRFTRKWYRNDRIISALTREDIWDDMWEGKKHPTTFIYNRNGHEKGKYHVRFYVGDEVVTGSFVIE